jgi:predicted permease
MIEVNTINLTTGILVLILNLIPLITKKTPFYGLTLPLSLLIVLIRVLFIK